MEIILVIEDEKNVRETLIDVLNTSGYHVISAENGTNGVQKIITNRPSLVLCDVNMPEMDGFEVLGKVNDYFQSNNEQSPLFIFLTARVEKKDIRKGINLGADDYILKPFSNKDLLDAVKAKLRQRGELQDAIIGNERSRISRSMHDSAQQKFIRAFYALRNIDMENESFSENGEKMLNYSKEELLVGLQELRDIINDIPGGDENITELLINLAKRIEETTGIETKVSCDMESNIDKRKVEHLFAIVQECCSNAIKHSESSKIELFVSEKNNQLQISVKDNGVGFESERLPKGLGLNNIQHRVNEIGGDLQIRSAPNSGTEISVICPN